MPGTIVFKPIEANLNVQDKDAIGKMDPYCLFHVGNQKIKGQVCKSGGNHPTWNDEVCVDLKDQSGICTIDVKDKDMLIDEKLGTFEVNLNEIESQGQIRKWFPLFLKNKPSGEILLEVYLAGAKYSQSQGLQGQQGLYQGQSLQGQQGLYQGQSLQGQSLQGQNLQGQQGLYQGQSLQGQQQHGQQVGPYMETNLAGPHQQSNLGTNYPSNVTGFSQTPSNQNYPQSHTDQYAHPSNTQKNVMYNASQSVGLQPQSYDSQGYVGQQYSAQAFRNQDPGLQGLQNPSLGQNLAQNPYSSGTDPLIYEGDANRFNNPPQQMPFGHGHHTAKDPLNPQQRTI